MRVTLGRALRTAGEATIMADSGGRGGRRSCTGVGFRCWCVAAWLIRPPLQCLVGGRLGRVGVSVYNYAALSTPDPSQSSRLAGPSSTLQISGRAARPPSLCVMDSLVWAIDRADGRWRKSVGPAAILPMDCRCLSVSATGCRNYGPRRT